MLTLNESNRSVNEDKQPNTQKIVTISIPVTVAATSKRDSPKYIINNDLRVLQNFVVRTITQDGTLCIQNPNQVINTSNESEGNKKLEETLVPIVPGTSNTFPKNTIYLKPIPKRRKQELVPKSNTNQLFRCIKCPEQFHTLVDYRKHMLNHRNSRKYQCEKCTASYNNERNMEIHMAMHTEGKPSCPLCNVTFQRLASLKSHLMLHQVEEIFTCEECKSEYDDEESLLKHYEIHVLEKCNENKPLECPYCKVVYEDTNQLKEHISYHVKLKKLVWKGKRPKKKAAQQGNTKKLGAHACDKCNKRFTKACLLERHMRTHTGEKPFVCTICNHSFTQKGTLQIHLNKHTGLKPFECTLCPARFNQKGNLRVHIEKTHTAGEKNEKIYKCTSCTCIFKTVASLNGHVTKLHSKVNNENDSVQLVMKKLKELQQQLNQNAPTSKDKRPESESLMQVMKKLRELQNKQANSDNKLKLQTDNKNDNENVSYVRLAEPNQTQGGNVRRYLAKRVVIDGIRWYCCNYCSKQFKKPSDLMRHLRIHTKEKPFECKDCGQSFSLKSTLKSHMKTHKEKEIFKCMKCDKTFTSTMLLHNHTLKKHERKHTPTYECVKCKKVCKTTRMAHHHLDECHPTESFEECMKFILKQPIYQTPNGNLVIRKKVNSSAEKPYPCDVCNASFSRRLNLKAHMKIHLNDRNFKCTLCPKTFINSYKLKEHLKYHNNVRNYECNVCSKRFVTGTLLKRHLLIHSNEKPYMCPYCSKTFKTLSLIHQHLKKSHEGEITDANLHGIVEEEAVDENEEEIEYESIQNHENIQIQLQNNENVHLPINTIEITPNDLNSDLSQHTIYINSDGLQMDNENLPQSLLNLLNPQENANVPNEIDQSTVEFAANESEPNDINNLNTILNQNNVSWDDLNELITNLNPETGNNFNENLEQLIQQTPHDQQIDNGTNESLYANTFIICLSCNNQYDTVEHFKQHNCTENEANDAITKGKKKSNKQYECIFCDELINGRKMYVKHMAIHAKHGQSNSCIFCEKQFKKPSDLKRHIRTHTGEKPFNCEKCDKSFALKSTLISHMKTHNPNAPKEFKCDVCNTYFTVRSSLKVHMLMHTDKKPHSCTYCSETFRTAAHKRSHEHSQHLKKDHEVLKAAKKDVRIKNLLESVVSEIVNSQSNDEFNDGLQPLQTDGINQEIILEDNTLNVLNINTEGLDLTDAIQIDPLTLLQFQQASIQLQETSNIFIDANCVPGNEQYLQIDDAALLNDVNIQQETFENVVQSPEIQYADNVSVSERNLECDICKKCYASKDVLRKHRKMHTKQFPCTICGKSFDKEIDIEKHLSLHTGDRPFNCAYCANSFAEEGSLKTHLKRIHPEVTSSTAADSNDEFLLKFGNDFI